MKQLCVHVESLDQDGCTLIFLKTTNTVSRSISLSSCQSTPAILVPAQFQLMSEGALHSHGTSELRPFFAVYMHGSSRHLSEMAHTGKTE